MILHVKIRENDNDEDDDSDDTVDDYSVNCGMMVEISMKTGYNNHNSSLQQY